jgi:hypothetical protein
MELADYTLELAKPLIGKIFEVELPDGATAMLKLEDALPYEFHQRRTSRKAPTPKRAPFALYFTGQPAPVLSQAMYLFRSDGETFGSIFIVPVSRDEEGVEYEAVFT